MDDTELLTVPRLLKLSAGSNGRLRVGTKPTLEAAARVRPPAELWARFDEAVAELYRVSEGRSIRAVGRAYAELADAGSQIADRRA